MGTKGKLSLDAAATVRYSVRRRIKDRKLFREERVGNGPWLPVGTAAARVLEESWQDSDPTRRGVKATLLEILHTGVRLRGEVTHVWFNESIEEPERYPIAGPDTNISVRPARPIVRIGASQSSVSEGVLTFYTTRQDLPRLSMCFANASGLLKACAHCRGPFVVTREKGSPPATCPECRPLRRFPPQRFQAVWRRFVWRLAHQVRTGARTPGHTGTSSRGRGKTSSTGG